MVKFHRFHDCAISVVLHVGIEKDHCTRSLEPRQQEARREENVETLDHFVPISHFQQADKATTSETRNIGDVLLSTIASLALNPWKSAKSQWQSNPSPHSSAETPQVGEDGQPPTDEGGRKPRRSRGAKSNDIQQGQGVASRRITRSEAVLLRAGALSQVQDFARRQSEVSSDETMRRLTANRERMREERVRSLALERSLYFVRTNPDLDYEAFRIIRGAGEGGGRARIHFNSGDQC